MIVMTLLSTGEPAAPLTGEGGMGCFLPGWGSGPLALGCGSFGLKGVSQ